jgi:hypothetical protein
VLALAVPGVASAASGKPIVTIRAATGITPDAATLNATVNPNGAETFYYFEVGLTNFYGSNSTATSAGDGGKAKAVNTPVTGLAPATRYHYRLVARNRNGTVRTADRTFKTLPVPLGLLLGAAPNPIKFNTSTTLSGQLTGTGNGGRQVQLQANAWPYTAGFATVGNTVVTNPDGTFAFPILAIAVNTQYRVLMPSKPEVVSPIVTVGVKPVVHTKVSKRRVKRGKRVRFSGTVTPAKDGQPVAIQKLVKGAWITIANATLRPGNGTRSKFSRRVKFRRHGGTYRVLANINDGSYTPNNGRSIRIHVHH